MGAGGGEGRRRRLAGEARAAGEATGRQAEVRRVGEDRRPEREESIWTGEIGPTPGIQRQWTEFLPWSPLHSYSYHFRVNFKPNIFVYYSFILQYALLYVHVLK